MKVRIEHDSIGELEVPAEHYWGAQTQRSYQNFKIGTEKMPMEIVKSLAIVKRSCAIVNCNLGKLSEEKRDLIVKVCDEILDDGLKQEFPLALWQTGSGTQSNMNVNEVVSHRGNELAKKDILHPNDDVNKSQSSNDTFPTAMHIAAYTAVTRDLLPQLKDTLDVLYGLSIDYRDIVKVGRTHLQDATPLSLGQEISAWSNMIEKSTEYIEESSKHLLSLAIGGTAVGTGLNTPEGFDEKVCEEIKLFTGDDYKPSENKFHSLSSKDELVNCHGALKTLATNILKIANDVRFLASGPRCGIGELTIPANEPGSSIMPGKVNPTQAEAITMVVAQVLGNDTTISFSGSQGNFQLNVYMPVIIFNFLQSVRLLTDGLKSFTDNCLKGLKPNEEKIKEYLDNSLMLVTALNPYIGYENGAKIAKYAHENNTTLKKAALKLEILTEEDFDKYMKPEDMI
ncbi:class II fumarate hydratase [Lagierella sp.]|uniref:class II fumarate hydratase n=1 Tax=Lagierella sp. TaxID=2849657 RepID=UPI00261F2292|nr:class II fumarate hydratase [Lagierella sp.]